MQEYINLLTTMLHQEYDEPETELKSWENPIQFMVAVILSAQATDVGVNKVTPNLFLHYKTANDFANANLDELMQYVKSINYYKTKSQRIIDSCTYVVTNFNGTLPNDINLLIKIPGIGRKSANVILHEALNAESQGVVVDTHVGRLAGRLGLSTNQDPIKIEKDLMTILPQSEWRFYSNALVLHGRYVCKARKPDCTNCKLNSVCPSAFKV